MNESFEDVLARETAEHLANIFVSAVVKLLVDVLLVIGEKHREKQRRMSREAVRRAWKILVKKNKRVKGGVYSCSRFRVERLSRRFYVNKNRYVEIIRLPVVIK